MDRPKTQFRRPHAERIAGHNSFLTSVSRRLMQLLAVLVLLLAAAVSPAGAQESTESQPEDAGGESAVDDRARTLTPWLHRVSESGTETNRTTVRADFIVRVAFLRDGSAVQVTDFDLDSVEVVNGTVLRAIDHHRGPHIKFFEIRPDFGADSETLTVSVPAGSVEFEGETNEAGSIEFTIGAPLTVAWELQSPEPIAAAEFDVQLRLSHPVVTTADDGTAFEAWSDIDVTGGWISDVRGLSDQLYHLTLRRTDLGRGSVTLHVPAKRFVIRQASQVHEWNQESEILTVTTHPVPLTLQGRTSYAVPSGFSGDVGSFSATGTSENVEWSLSGPDSDMLQISSDGDLGFAAAYQYSGGDDADGDDVYEVTVEASTSGGRSGSADATVTVQGDGPAVLGLDFRLAGGPVFYPGDTIRVRVHFGDPAAPQWAQLEEPVVVDGAPQLLLNVGGTARTAEFLSARGPYVFFEYTVVDGDEDNNGVSIDSTSLRLNGGSITDRRGRHSPLTHGPVTDSAPHLVQPPPFEILGSSSATVYTGTDESVGTFSVTNYGAYVSWSLEGADKDDFRLTDVDDGVSLEFASQPHHAEPLDADGDSDYEVTIVAMSQVFEGYEATLDVVVTVSAAPPRIQSVEFSSSRAGGNYFVGDVITVNVRFDSGVTVTGTPQIALDIGGVERLADYAGSDGATAVFRYTIVQGDSDSDGVTIPANSLQLNGGTIVNADGTAAKLKHSAVEGGSSQRVAAPGGL